jgi:P-type Cu+ transporter
MSVFSPNQPAGDLRLAEQTTMLSLDVEGMMCQKNCGTTVQRALAGVEGVSRAEVSFLDKRARVWGTAPPQALIAAVEAIGFGAELSPTVVLDVEGMMCQKNCGSTVQQALSAVPGVTRAEVSFAHKSARVWGSASLTAEALIKTVDAVGFDAALAPDVVLAVEGMMCQKNCGTTAQNALSAVAGVTRAEVSHPNKQAKVWGSAASSALIAALDAVGFDAAAATAETTAAAAAAAAAPAVTAASSGSPRGKQLYSELPAEPAADTAHCSMAVFSVSGMSCAACVAKVERHLKSLPGVAAVRVALLAEKAEVDFDAAAVAEATMADAVTQLGYTSVHLRTTPPGTSLLNTSLQYRDLMCIQLAFACDTVV